MATSQSEPGSGSSQDLRCNKCRASLNVQSDHVQDIEGKNLDQTLIFLREDCLPQWIELKVEEVTTNLTLCLHFLYYPNLRVIFKIMYNLTPSPLTLSFKMALSFYPIMMSFMDIPKVNFKTGDL